MTIAGLSSNQFLEILKANGYEVLDQENWEREDVQRIVIGKDGHTFAFRVNYFYNSSEVIKRMDMLKVDLIPDEYAVEYEACVKEYERKMEWVKNNGHNHHNGSATIDKPHEPEQ